MIGEIDTHRLAAEFLKKVKAQAESRYKEEAGRWTAGLTVWRKSWGWSCPTGWRP